MLVHPCVHQLSKRLWFYSPLAGALALVTHLFSLSKGAYPGYSAALIAEAAGLSPSPGVAHPVFSFLVRQVAALDVFSLTVRLNLFSALCGSACALLLYVLVGNWVLCSACEDEGGGARNELDDFASEMPPLPPEVEAYNRRVLKVAVAGGLTSAFLLALMVPTWSAATRLDNGLFDLALALAAFVLFPFSGMLAWPVRLLLSVFLFVLGAFSSAVFILLLPLYAILFFKMFLACENRGTMLGVTVVAGAAGCALSLVLCRLGSAPHAVEGVSLGVLGTLVRGVVSHHYHELHMFFPKAGWLLAVLQVGLPGAALIFGRQSLFKERNVSTLVAVLLMAAAALPSLLNLPVAPFFLFLSANHLPVFVTALQAVAVSCALSACLIFLGPEDEACEIESRPEALKGVAVGLAGLLLLFVALAPFRSFRAVDARQGAFADQMAREMLAAMGGRTCLVTKDLLDPHLLVQARMLNQPLTLIPILSRGYPQEFNTLRNFISTSPVLEGLNRQRLQNALSIGTARFVTEWLNTDADAERHVMAMATPDIWTACGYQVVPERLAFGGAKTGDKLDLDRLAEENQAFIKRVTPSLARQYPEYGLVAALRARLRAKAGFASNELGVLLEEQGRFEEAFSAYGDACAVDPANVSGAVNAYALSQIRGIHPELCDALKKKMNIAVQNAGIRGPQDFPWILQNYGTIRQQAFYRQQQVMWSSLGMGVAAASKTRKIQSLAERTGADALIENAAIYLQTGDLANAEKCYLAVLEKDATNRDSLIGLCTLKIAQGQAQEAEKWYHRALDASVEPLAMRYQTISIALLKKETERALKLLEAATQDAPADLRYWTMYADLLLSRGDTLLVERQLLPDMQKALKTQDHYLVHAIRGMVLRAKGPEAYKEARLSLLRALSLNASLPDVWRTLLELDVAIGHAAFTESDARHLLQIDPDHGFANYLMGALLLSRSQLPESEDFLRRSIEKHPTAAAYNDLAENLRLQKKLQEAEVSVRRALELDPKLIPALDTLANILCDAGRLVEAAKVGGQAVAAEPDFDAYQITLLRAQVKLGDKAGVAQRMSRLVSTQSAIPDALLKEVESMK